MFFAVTPDAQLQPIRQGVHNGHTHAVQTARDLVGVAVKLTARVQLGHDDLGRRDALFWVDIHRNTTAIVADGNRAVGVDFHGHIVGVTRQSLVDAVVHDLIDHMV